MEKEKIEEQSILIIYGCGGHARSIADVAHYNEPSKMIMFVDENIKHEEKILGMDSFKEIPPHISKYNLILGIGDNKIRKGIYDDISKKFLTSVISKRAYLGINIKIGKGCFIAHCAHIGPEAAIGNNTIINTAAVVEHEVKIGEHCHIAPNATISGRTIVGDLVFVGVGATVIDKIKICSNVIIGAGATVISDINEPGTYIGTPTRKIK